MNYRHIYHAGNFADVLKHIVLTLCIQHLQKKQEPICVVDAHAGAGLYDLNSVEAAKTREWEAGVGRLRGGAHSSDLELYIDRVRSDLDNGLYPGSPLLIARSLRPQDRLIANELHAPTYNFLAALLQPFDNVRTTQTDAYECVRAHIPPRERRGLVLIDPPFEKKDEFATLMRQMKEWKKRWPTGVYLLWYPIKQHLPVAELKDAARALAIRRTWFVETLIFPPNTPDRLNGCGLMIFNAPYTLPERVEKLAQELQVAMSLHAVLTGWLVPDLSTT